jgi:uncharacterized protein (UPF0276 family)
VRDRVGISWRRVLAAAIVADLDRIDVVELMAEDYFGAPRRELRALRTLAAHVPIVLHGVSLGLASASPTPARLIERIARLVDALEPESWSEHLAFVRAQEIELGHLAAPPRTEATVDGACRNLRVARAVVGSAPQMENVATLIDPPGSTTEEGAWISSIVAASGCELLLDLHNLHANAVNFRFDPLSFLERIPLERVGTIHVAGGRWVNASEASGAERRWLDDHLHSVPAAVYRLLQEVAARAPRALTVILERDGRFPPFATLLDEMACAREALRRGRARRARATECAA